MNITYNNLNVNAASNLITFTDIPNILKVTDDASGNRATIMFTFQSNLASITTSDGQWTIRILGESVYNTTNAANAVNKNFYVSTSNVSTAASLTRALRNCGKVSSLFTVIHNENTVALVARNIGEIPNVDLTTNISTTYLNKSFTQGSSNSELYGCLVDVDVYQGSDYITTLEKNYYDGEVAFDMSPVLTTISNVGETKPYSLRLSTIKNGDYTSLGNISTNYISVGYMCNQGNKYLFNDVMNVADNFYRGTNKDSMNNTILYLYNPKIKTSFYCGSETGFTITVTYLGSAYNSIGSSTIAWRKTNQSQVLYDLDITLDESLLVDAFYVDVQLGSLAPIRYNVIKPIKAAEDCQRVYWRNAYGGISFFDFTGQRSETRDFEFETYQKSIYNYYDDTMNELEKVYDNDVKYSVTLKSHLMENDGKYVFNDIIQSPLVWTVINGETYAIILDSVNVDEVDRNDIYEATIKYHYSQEPSII